jgi:tetratricopeptide (TPR) repeat protein
MRKSDSPPGGKNMKHRLAGPALIVAALLAALCVAPSFAQVGTGTVRGVCKDRDGKPIAGATVSWVSSETGRKYELKTNSKGEYFSLGIGSGKYTVTLLQNGQELFHYNGFMVTLDNENTLDFDLQKEQAKAAAGAGLTPEQLKARQEQQEKVAKENMTVKTLNEKLAAAKQAADAGDYDTAVSTLTQATQMDPSRDLLWAKLGEYEAISAGKQSDSAEKTKRYDAAISAYEKAVDIKQKSIDASTQKTPDATKILAMYYNNLGQAAGKDGKTDDALKAYTQAAQLDPAGAGQYYFNIGAIMTNAGKVDEAIAAFDKAIAADPNRAEAYYWKGVNLIGKATLKGDKMIAPDGTAEAFQKYLELQPNGPFADPAKQMLASIGASVETQYGKKKPPKK